MIIYINLTRHKQFMKIFVILDLHRSKSESRKGLETFMNKVTTASISGLGRAKPTSMPPSKSLLSVNEMALVVSTEISSIFLGLPHPKLVKERAQS